MIVMLNGAFGVGKTTLASELLTRHRDWMLFDPEEVGFMLWKVCPGPRGDFQELPPWTPLVVETARALVAAYGRTLVVPMTLVEFSRFRAIRAGFETIAPTHHFALLAPPETIARRLVGRGDAEGTWAHNQLKRCAVLEREEFTVHLDAERPVKELADMVVAGMRSV